MDENDINTMPPTKKHQQPKSSGQIISAFLIDRWSTFRELAMLRQKGWSNEGAGKHFQNQRINADEASNQTRGCLYALMKRIGDELQAATEALSLPIARAKILDICMASGGYSASVIKYSPDAHISAITLPKHLGGFPVMVDHGPKDPRINVKFADVTMLAAEYGITDVPKGNPDFGKLVSWRPFAVETFDLVLCDGQVLRTQTPHVEEHREAGRATRLTCGQLILGMQRIKPGGTFNLLLHRPEMSNTVKLLSLFDKISEIRLLKLTVAHRTRSSFYLVAKNVQSQRPEALLAIAYWKSTWKSLTFPSSQDEKENEQQQEEQMRMEAKEAMGLLSRFGDRLLESEEPVRLIQRDALKKAPWLKCKETGPPGHVGGGS